MLDKPILLALLLAALAGCSSPTPSATESSTTAENPVRSPPTARAHPFVRVLGTAQDGGLPHIACSCDRCETARTLPDRSRLVASLAIVLPNDRKVFLVDATPDVRVQLELLEDVRDAPQGRVDRSPIDGIFLTHAHVGHYLGLALFGFEAVHTQEMPVYGTQRMADFLSSNGPWSLMVERRNIDLRPLTLNQPVELGEGVRVTAVAVPHRDELTDTVGFAIEGPAQSLFYVPDTDSWTAWEPPIEEVLTRFDVAMVDGTFFSLDELPGRSVESIGHPLIAESLERLTDVVAARTRVFFTHLNHSNPAVHPDSTAHERIQRAGFEVLTDGLEISL